MQTEKRLMKFPRIYRPLLVAALATLVRPGVSFGWGRDGHAIVAEIAYDRLSVNARREVRKLLGDDTMVEVSSWADQIGRDHPETKTWHYVDIPVDGKPEHFDELRDGLKGNNVVDKLKDFEKTLADRNAKKEDRIVALKWVIHLVGDIHQPLHCADRAFGHNPGDRGGNDVAVEFEHSNRPFNLHSAWDSAILDRDILPEGEEAADFGDDLAKMLDDRKNIALQANEQKWRSVDDPVAWANESHDLAATIVYKNIPTTEPTVATTSPASRPAIGQLLAALPAPTRATTSATTRPLATSRPTARPTTGPFNRRGRFTAQHLIELTPAYLDRAEPVIVEQLEKGGVRLADVLNGMFP